jgi:hypothetical protein
VLLVFQQLPPRIVDWADSTKPETAGIPLHWLCIEPTTYGSISQECVCVSFSY